MIEVQNVSMRFNLGIEKNNSLKQMAVDSFGKLVIVYHGNGIYSYYAHCNRIRCKAGDKVEKGEVLGFVGSNGAGKSTLLKIVAGVMKPTKGKVLVGGNICPMIELGAGFDLDLNARENIYLNGAVMGYSKSFLDSKFQEIVDFSELQDFLDVPVRNFSSGMVARLAFSVATIVDPEILIVDEILSVGDLNFQNKSENKMRSLISGGTTVLYVSHSIKSIESLCDRVVWLEHGKVVMVGKTDDVCKAYYESQMGK